MNRETFLPRNFVVYGMTLKTSPVLKSLLYSLCIFCIIQSHILYVTGFAKAVDPIGTTIEIQFMAFKLQSCTVQAHQAHGIDSQV